MVHESDTEESVGIREVVTNGPVTQSFFHSLPSHTMHTLPFVIGWVGQTYMLNGMGHTHTHTIIDHMLFVDSLTRIHVYKFRLREYTTLDLTSGVVLKPRNDMLRGYPIADNNADIAEIFLFYPHPLILLPQRKHHTGAIFIYSILLARFSLFHTTHSPLTRSSSLEIVTHACIILCHPYSHPMTRFSHQPLHIAVIIHADLITHFFIFFLIKVSEIGRRDLHAPILL